MLDSMRNTLMVLLALAAAGVAEEKSPIVGTWSMKTRLRGEEIGAKLVIRIDKAGKLTGEWQGLGRDLKLENVKFANGVLTFDRTFRPGMTIGFSARLEGDTLTGAHRGSTRRTECTGIRISEADLRDPAKDFEVNSVRGAPRDGFVVLDNPKMTKAADAKLGGDQPVIGIEIGGEAQAYPVRVMGSHEIVNTTCGGKPIAVTW